MSDGYWDTYDGEPASVPMEYKLQVCIDIGKHNLSCDNDGYCNNCGHQWVPEE